MKNLSPLLRLPAVTGGATLAGLILATMPVSGALVSYYNFDGGNNTDQVGPNDGQVNNQSGYSTDTPDGSAFALDLTGSDPNQDYVRIGSAPPNGPDFNIGTTNDFTISMWVNYTASMRGIVSIRHDLTSGGGALDRSGVTFGLNSSGNPFVGLVGSSPNDAANSGTTFHDVTTNQIVATSNWTHMAATYNGGTDLLQIYVDGTAATTYTDGNGSSSMNPDGSSLTGGVGAIDLVDTDGSFTGFGAAGNAPSHSSSAGDFTRLFYDGLLDDVAIWDNALTAGEITLLANGTAPPAIPEPTTPLLAILGLSFAALRRRRKPGVSKSAWC